MSKVAKDAMETIMEGPGFVVRRVDWGGMTFAYERAGEPVDPAPLFAGLPTGRCECPHWGYVLEGEITLRYENREEVIRAGEVYYAAPGHIPLVRGSAAILELSVTEQLQATLEGVHAAMAAAGPTA